MGIEGTRLIEQDRHFVFEIPYKNLKTSGKFQEFAVGYLDDKCISTRYSCSDYGSGEIFKMTAEHDTTVRVGVTTELYRASSIHETRNFRGLAFGSSTASLEALSIGTQAGAFDFESPIGFTTERKLEAGKTYYVVPFKDVCDARRQLAAELIFYHNEADIKIEEIKSGKPICLRFCGKGKPRVRPETAVRLPNSRATRARVMKM